MPYFLAWQGPVNILCLYCYNRGNPNLSVHCPRPSLAYGEMFFFANYFFFQIDLHGFIWKIEVGPISDGNKDQNRKKTH